METPISNCSPCNFLSTTQSAECLEAHMNQSQEIEKAKNAHKDKYKKHLTNFIDTNIEEIARLTAFKTLLQ